MAKKKTATKKKSGTSRQSGSTKKGKSTLPTREEAVTAADAAREWLAEREDYYGYLARQDLGRGAPELASHLRGDLLARQHRAGYWPDEEDKPSTSIVETAEAIWRLLDLGLNPDAGAIKHAINWLHERRDAPGAYGEGCTPSRHEQQICEHFIGGFFSPGPPDRSMEITLPNGQTVGSDAGARLLISERALRSILRADRRNPQAQASIDGLKGLPLYLEYGGNFTPAVLVGAIQALGWAGPAHRNVVEAGLETLADNQEKDGTWPNVEFFFVLEALLEAHHPLAERLMLKALRRLLDTQYNYGAWGRVYQVAQTRVGMLVLERIAPSLPRAG